MHLELLKSIKKFKNTIKDDVKIGQEKHVKHIKQAQRDENQRELLR